MKQFSLLAFSFLSFYSCVAQPLNQKKGFTRQDTLRGTIGPERAWWDVQHYDIRVTPDFNTKSIKGETVILYRVLKGQSTDYMQIDLQQPLVIDSLFYDGKMYINNPARPFYNEGNVWHVSLPKAPANSEHRLRISYHGVPREAKTPPWDGGWIFKKDAQGRPWMSVACQGLGASVWYPCKDHQTDEPDKGARITVVAPDDMSVVANGHPVSAVGVTNWNPVLYGGIPEKFKATTWEVTNPINSYNIVPYIGKYVNWSDTMAGEKGTLSLNYWVLDYELEKAKKQFEQVKPTIKAFEYWFGPYPFYEDGYQLVQAPHLGMEHQSAVAYGNGFKNGYMGMDLSGTGKGLNWDYIIVHESGHEWFGNNITSKDIADMWVHEGFTDYSETLFIEYYYGKAAANTYLQGLRKNIENDIPIIGPYGVNQEGSGDMYFKGANTIHTIRQVINDDVKFRNILRGLNKTFYHQTVTTKQVEDYIIRESGKDLAKIFDQYLRSTAIPVLETVVKRGAIDYRWTNCVDGFNMPVSLNVGNPNGQLLEVTPKKDKWTSLKLGDWFTGKTVEADKNYYIEVKKR